MDNKIYQVEYNGETDAICAVDEKQAIKLCIEDNGLEESDIEGIKEVPESEWDSKKVNIWEDNDTTKEPFEVTYRELYANCGYPEIICSTQFQ